MATINISIPDGLYMELKKICIRDDVKMSQLFRRGVTKLFLEDDGKRK